MKFICILFVHFHAWSLKFAWIETHHDIVPAPLRYSKKTKHCACFQKEEDGFPYIAPRVCGNTTRHRSFKLPGMQALVSWAQRRLTEGKLGTAMNTTYSDETRAKIGEYTAYKCTSKCNLNHGICLLVIKHQVNNWLRDQLVRYYTCHY